VRHVVEGAVLAVPEVIAAQIVLHEATHYNLYDGILFTDNFSIAFMSTNILLTKNFV
jgi:hypothetical protein